MNDVQCSFCEKGRREVKKMVSGPERSAGTVYICDECIEIGYAAVTKSKAKPAIENAQPTLPTPEEIKAYLDQYIIEQHQAKEVLSVAIYNHYKRINNPIVDDTELKKANVLLLGPSGTGKTLMVSTVAKMLKLPFVQTDATTLTEAGYVGEDVENMIDRLVQAANGDIELAQKGIIYIDEIDKKSRKSESSTVARDVSGEGVQQALLKLVEGTIIRLPGSDRPFNTKDLLFIAGGAFVGLDEIVKSRKKDHSTIGFHARLDKQATSVLLYDLTSVDLIKYGLIPEFVGRFPIVVSLHELDEEMLIKILTQPKNCLIDQYKCLFSLDLVDLEFAPEYIRSIANTSMKQMTGARGLQNMLEKTLLKVQFHLPTLKKNGVEKVIISEQGQPTYLYEKKKVNDE
jgi:ATP-dependent Clp protease ATP-binding subunit ClpX